jgi:transcription antitermination factor NusA-like protein
MEENIKGFIPREEQIPGEKLVPGVKYQFLIKSVIENSKT